MGSILGQPPERRFRLLVAGVNVQACAILVRSLGRVALGGKNCPESEVAAGIEVVQRKSLAIVLFGGVAVPLAEGNIS